MSWREAQHPRNPRNGRFVERGGGWAEAVASQLAPSGNVHASGGRVRGRDLAASGWVGQHRDDLAARLAQWRDDGFPYGDPIIGAIAAEQGFDGRPEVGGSAEVDAAIRSGGVELFRGYGPIHLRGEPFPRRAPHERGPEFDRIQGAMDDWREGPYKAGSGIYGQGTYASVSREAARGYGVFGPRYGYPDEQQGDESSIQRMALKPGARVVDWGDPEILMQFDLDPYALAGQTWDFGRAAAAMGYDAMRVPSGEEDGSGRDEEQYVIFNRTALIVEAR